MWRKGNPSALVQPLWKAVWRYLEKLKMALPYDPAIPLLGIYPKTPKTLIWKHMCTPMFIAALFTITKIWMQPKCPSVDKWIQWNITQPLKKKEILPLATAWVYLEGIMLSKISQRKKNTIGFHSYVKSKEQNKQKRKSHKCRDWWLPEGSGSVSYTHLTLPTTT